MDYSEFRKQYELQHPASVPALEYETNPYPGWLKWAVLAMFVCAALLSGVHTVPTVRAGIPVSVTPAIRDVVSALSFVAVELAIFIAAYALVGGTSLLVLLVMGTATLVAMVANINSVINAYQGDDIWTLFVAVTLGIAAPGIALMAGKLFVNMHRASRGVESRAQGRYRESRVIFDKEIERAWKAYQRSAARDSSPDFTKVHETSKPRIRLHEVAREIHENGDAGLSSAEMMAKYGISLGSTSKVREILRADGTNGHADGQHDD